MIQTKKITISVLALLAVLPFTAQAQEFMQSPSPNGMPLSAQPPQGQAPAPAATQQQIDQLVAPIALYPDQLVGQILMASTYPLEIVEATRWRQDPNNAQLQGDDLAEALEQQPWDPSVKSIVPLPQVLSMMNDNLQWTEQLGDAFLGQQAAVSESVQRLRQMAQASGHLASTPQQTVVADQGYIVIQPANPEVIYVPVYNPRVVYGVWPWAAYEPYYFPPPPGFFYASTGVIGFSVGFGVIDVLWGWDRWDWRHHRIDIDDRRFERINRGRPPSFSGNVWEHDPGHRHGVPYANPVARARFQGAADNARRTHDNDFRGFGNSPALNRSQNNNARPADNNGGRNERHSAFQRSGSPNDHQRVAPQNNPPTPAVAPQVNAPEQSQQHEQKRQQFQHESMHPQQPQHETMHTQPIQQQAQPEPQPQAQRQPQQEHQQRFQHQTQQPQQRQASPVFESFSRGPDVRVQSQRGSESRASTPVAAPPAAQSAADKPHGASGGDHNNRNGGDDGGRHDRGGNGRDDNSRNR